jgi:uncharacterized membrane protein YphA (DoxX/SURF4 family)
MRNGKIAMKLPEDDSVSLVNARICSEDDDVMLVTARGRAIRFPPPMCASSRAATRPACAASGWLEGDRVVSMAVIRHFEASPEERAAYLKMRRLMAGRDRGTRGRRGRGRRRCGDLNQERYAEMSAAEDLILTITAAGRASSAPPMTTRCAGAAAGRDQAMDKAMRGGPLVASFPVEMEDQIMLATSTGQSIRVPVEGISFRSRSAGGCACSTPAPDEEVVSVSPGSPTGSGRIVAINFLGLIASYFMATAVGSIPGADTGALLAPLLNEPLSRVVAGSIVFTLATMVLIGKQTRLAALLLGLLTFYASYLHMVQMGIDHVLGAFWRDMALIAALMLTYGGPAKAPPPAQSTTFTIRRIARRAERARQMGAPHQPIAPILHAEPDASRVPANDLRRAEPATA